MHIYYEFQRKISFTEVYCLKYIDANNVTVMFDCLKKFVNLKVADIVQAQHG
jgi:hypothetical protein